MPRSPFRLGRLYVILLLTVAVVRPGQAQWPADGPSRDSLTARLRELGRIHTPNGIEELEAIEVNGSRQWLSIRGLDRRNPVLLVLHGGPGSAMMGMTWAYQKPWEDFFTVVNWDQRGVGKSFSAADSARLGATLSPEQLAQDAAVVVAHLRRKLGVGKVALLGFSYGTSIGPRLAELHPEWISVYVGAGQMTNADNEGIIYRELLARVRAAGDTAVQRELEALAPYPPRDRRPTYRELGTIRRYTARFNGNWYGKPDLRLWYALPQWGPDYTADDVAAVNPAMSWMGSHLIDGRNGERPHIVERFRVPVVILGGRFDLMTTYDGARAYFARVQAPSKRFITFERSAHFLMFEEPGRFLTTLVDVVRPLAAGATPTAP